MPPATLPRGTSESGPGTLYVVATPIGNLEDITLRALRILREVAVVAAEDTRRTGNLLRHYQIATPLTSLHEHNEHRKRTAIVERLLAGESVALVSDAGTPGISDPGALLVAAARAARVRVDPIPGPSAITAALSASGIRLERFAFAGFPPIRSKDRKLWFGWVASLADIPVVCFEAPHRIRKTLIEMQTKLVERPITVARELTKTYEEWSFDAPAAEERGEFVLIVGQKTNLAQLPPEPTVSISLDGAMSASSQAAQDAEVVRVFGEMTKTDMYDSKRSAVKAVAERLGLPSRAVYSALERSKT